MKPYTPEEIRGYAAWLTQECQAAGLNAEQYGAEILIQGASNHLSERILCRPDARGELRWHWSWGTPLAYPGDPERLLGVEDIADLVRAVSRAVAVPLKGERFP